MRRKLRRQVDGRVMHCQLVGGARQGEPGLFSSGGQALQAQTWSATMRAHSSCISRPPRRSAVSPRRGTCMQAV